jgi:hypothetical protein
MTKTLDSTAVYAYTTLISMLVCSPFMFIMEGSQLAAGAQAAIAKVGAQRFYTDLFMVGLLYHLYNQFAFNTLQRVSPVSHGVCNVVKRVVIIFSSVIFFNQVLTTQVRARARHSAPVWEASLLVAAAAAAPWGNQQLASLAAGMPCL